MENIIFSLKHPRNVITTKGPAAGVYNFVCLHCPQLNPSICNLHVPFKLSYCLHIVHIFRKSNCSLLNSFFMLNHCGLELEHDLSISVLLVKVNSLWLLINWCRHSLLILNYLRGSTPVQKLRIPTQCAFGWEQMWCWNIPAMRLFSHPYLHCHFS